MQLTLSKAAYTRPDETVTRLACSTRQVCSAFRSFDAESMNITSGNAVADSRGGAEMLLSSGAEN